MDQPLSITLRSAADFPMWLVALEARIRELGLTSHLEITKNRRVITRDIPKSPRVSEYRTIRDACPTARDVLSRVRNGFFAAMEKKHSFRKREIAVTLAAHDSVDGVALGYKPDAELSLGELVSELGERLDYEKWSGVEGGLRREWDVRWRAVVGRDIRRKDVVEWVRDVRRQYDLAPRDWDGNGDGASWDFYREFVGALNRVDPVAGHTAFLHLQLMMDKAIPHKTFDQFAARTSEMLKLDKPAL